MHYIEITGGQLLDHDFGTQECHEWSPTVHSMLKNLCSRGLIPYLTWKSNRPHQNPLL